MDSTVEHDGLYHEDDVRGSLDELSGEDTGQFGSAEAREAGRKSVREAAEKFGLPNPLFAIREMCVQCHGGRKSEGWQKGIRMCNAHGKGNDTDCHLWPFRLGRRPKSIEEYEFWERQVSTARKLNRDKHYRMADAVDII